MATIKKTILLALTALIMVGCDYQSSYETSKSLMIRTVVIDSCEYIEGYFTRAHKGNCRFCEERDSIKWEKRKKELKELVIKLKGK